MSERMTASNSDPAENPPENPAVGPEGSPKPEEGAPSTEPETPSEGAGADKPKDSFHEYEKNRIYDVLGNRGRTAIIATKYSESDRENAIAEAIEMKANQTTQNNIIGRAVTKIPIIGTIVKAGFMHHYKRTAISAVDETGSLSKAFESLKLDPISSKVLNSDSDKSAERAMQLLQNAGFSEDNQVESARSVLDENEKVEKIQNPEVQNAVKAALNQYYLGLKENKNAEELKKAYDETVNQALANEEDAPTIKTAVDKQLSDLEKLAKEASITEKSVEKYLDQHVSLYRATMKEGIYTKKEVDSLANAVIAGSVFGVVSAVLSSRETRKAARGVSTALGASNIVAGAVAGAAAGAIRGIDKAKVQLSAHEINAATKFDEQSSTETEPKPAEGESEGTETEPKPAEGEPSSKKEKQKRSIIDTVRRFTRGKDILEEIETKRDRKNADYYIDRLNELATKYEGGDDSVKEDLEGTLADAVARGLLSSEKQIDLIKYKDGEQRNLLEKNLYSAAKSLYKTDNSDIINGQLSTANQKIMSRKDELEENYKDAEALERKFKRRIIAVNAVEGAIIGATAAAGAGVVLRKVHELGLFGGVRDFTETLGEDDKFELSKDPDGGYTVKLGGEELIGKGEETGIEFNSDGSLTPESEELLKNAGIEFEAHESEPIEIAHSNMNLKEFFDSSNRESNNLTEITGRSWITDNAGRDQVIIGNTHMDGDGNIVMQVAPTQGSSLNLDDMKMVFTAGDGNIDNAIVVDVNPDGTIEIPAGSPAASLFDGENYQGGYAELAQIDADGHMDVYNTIGDGHPDISTISVPNSDVTYTDGYTFTIDGESQEVSLPEDIAATAKMEAINGIESAKGLGETVYNETTGDITNLQTNAGEAVEVEHFEHHGGYSDIYDSYFGEKDGVYNSGASLVRQMLGDEANGLSSQEADQLFLEKINNGEISEGDVVEDYLNVVGNSPEALATTRAMLGDFKMDLDGDGTLELIDTQDEINRAADILGSGDSEAYDNFVNDTYDTFYEKIDGGSIRFVDQSQEQYQYTTWGVLGDNNNILQRLGVVGDRPTDGVGIVFMDKDGNSIYDEETVRKLWHLPDNYDISYVADRLDCIQKTARGIFEDKTTDEKTTDEKTTDEKSTDEKTTDEKSTDEKTTEEKTTEEKTTEEKTTEEKTTGEKTTEEKTTGEKTTEEDTIEPKDYENMERIDNNINNDIADNVGTDDIKNHTDLGTTEPTDQPSGDDYQGTEPSTVTNDDAPSATHVQDTVTPENDYSHNNGGSHDDAYSPNHDNDVGQSVANEKEQSIESAPSNGDESFEEEMEELTK